MGFLKLAPALAMLVLLGGCGGPPRWMQFHADGQGRGFVGVHSSAATSAMWFADVGPVGFSSPSLGLDGTIYVGNHNGELVAVNPDGSIKWRFQAPFSDHPFIASSPAVSSSGLIYFIVTHGVGANGGTSPGESVLFSIDPAKNVRCSLPLLPRGAPTTSSPPVTTSSPRTWTSGSNINVIVATGWGAFNGLLEVFDQECRMLATATWECPHDVEGGGLDWKSLLGIFTDGLSLLFASPFQFQVQGRPISLLDPTPAIVDFPGEAGKAMIVAGTTACGLHAFAWDPSALMLTPQWAQPNARNSISSPAVSHQGQVVIGQDDGHVLAFDLMTGHPLWDFDAGELVLATPAFFVGATQVYVASRTHVHKIDTDGTLVQTIGFPATLSSAAMTWDFVYIGSDAGLFTLEFDLSTKGLDSGALGGGSSPVVGPDGTVFAVGVDHILRAYRR